MALHNTIIQTNTSGNIVGIGIPEHVFMQDYAAGFCEWIDGTVIKMSPVHDRHDRITRYLAILFEAYLEHQAIAQIRQEPFVMRYEYDENGETRRRNREPDIQIILNTHRDKLTPTYTNGAADIVIEVVSLESQQCDYAEKFHEYEQAGVVEYWIIDPIKQEARFYRLNDKQAYVLQEHHNQYQTSLLPKWVIDTPTMWQDKLPEPAAIVKSVGDMLK